MVSLDMNEEVCQAIKEIQDKLEKMENLQIQGHLEEPFVVGSFDKTVLEKLNIKNRLWYSDGTLMLFGHPSRCHKIRLEVDDSLRTK